MKIWLIGALKCLGFYQVMKYLQNEARRFSSIYESAYNIYRRISIANSLWHHLGAQSARPFYRSAFSDLLNRYDHENRLPINCKVIKGNDWSNISTRFGIGCYRQCAECAKVVFHSDLYNFEWMEICPIHNSKLTHICPDCNRCWPYYEDIYQRECTTCGNSYKSGATLEREKVQGKITAEFSSLQSIVGLVDSSSISHIDLDHRYINRDAMTPNNRYAASVLWSANRSMIYKRQKKYLNIKPFNTRTYSTSLCKTKISTLEYNALTCPEDKDIVKIRLKVIRDISNAVNKILEHEHCLKLTPENEYSNVCPYCEAFGYWVRAISYKPDLHSTGNYTCEIYKKLGGIQIITPVLMRTIRDRFGRQIFVPKQLQLLLYELDLKWSYVALYDYHCDFRFNLESCKTSPKVLTYLEQTISLRHKRNLFDAYWVDFKDDKIIFSYLSEKLISENSIPKDERLSYNGCEIKPQISFKGETKTKTFLNGLVEMTEREYAYLTSAWP